MSMSSETIVLTTPLPPRARTMRFGELPIIPIAILTTIALLAIFADVLAPLDELQAAAMTLAGEIAEAAPLAVQSTRATFRADLAAAVKAQTDHELVEQTWLRKTKDFAEGVRAVNERRSGNFVGA